MGKPVRGSICLKVNWEPFLAFWNYLIDLRSLIVVGLKGPKISFQSQDIPLVFDTPIRTCSQSQPMLALPVKYVDVNYTHLRKVAKLI
jgi:hypothetical protein